MIKCIYLCAREHRLDDIEGVDFWYNDIEDLPGIDFVCDALAVDLDAYDLLIATPPCNYYSRGNYRRDKSNVALRTRHLLPDILEKFAATGKPFLVENVQNSRLLKPFADKYPCVYWGSHSFSTRNGLSALTICWPRSKNVMPICACAFGSPSPLWRRSLCGRFS